MHRLIIHIITALVIAACTGNAATAQSLDLTHINEMERRADTLHGYSKAAALLDIAKSYEYISITKSMYFCQRTLDEIMLASGSRQYYTADSIPTEPDSLLDMRAETLMLLGKCYINLNDESVVENSTSNETKTSNKEHALELFSALHDIRLRQNKTAELAQADNCIAVTMMVMGNNDSAMAIFNHNIAIYQRINDKTGLAKTYNNIALIMCQNPRQMDRANSFFRKALRFAEEDSVYNIYIQASLNLADNYRKKGNNTMAYQYLNNAVPICEQCGNIVNLNMIYLELADLNKTTGNYKEAYEYMEKYNSLRDTIFNMENLKLSQELKAKYDIATKDSEINKLTEEKDQKEQKLYEDARMMFRQKIYLGVAMVLFLLALYGFLHAHRETISKNKTNALLTKANNNINNSINYASRLQKIIITGERNVKDLLKDYFVFHRPRSIVSGDFYYVRDFGNYMVVAVADCTGHGVPAAFLSVLHITFFNEIFRNNSTAPDPGAVLDNVRNMTIKALNQNDDLTASTDGMDCGLLIMDKASREARYAGGYIDLYIARHGTGNIDVIRSTHNPVCWYFKQIPFKTQNLNLDPDDIIYMFSDGYTDQVGPRNSEKFTKKRLKETLERISGEEMENQKNILQQELEQWQQNAKQIDDILILGIRVSSLYQLNS